MKKIRAFILLVLIPILLLAVWFAGSLFFNKAESFTTLTYRSNDVSFTSFPNEGILRNGEKITGSFNAHEKHLGTVTLLLNESIRQDDDYYLQLKIRKSTSNKWLYEIKDRSRSFKEMGHYTFGFPILNNNKEEKIVFEITAEKIAPYNLIKVSKKNLLLNTKYKFNKAEIVQSPLRFLSFVYTKISLFITNPEMLIATNHFFIGFALYMIGVLYITKRLTNFANVTLALIALDIILVRTQIGVINVSLFLLLIASVIQNKKKSAWSLQVAFALFILSAVFSIFGQYTYIDKASTWVYLFLIVFTVQKVRELRFAKKL